MKNIAKQICRIKTGSETQIFCIMQNWGKLNFGSETRSGSEMESLVMQNRGKQNFGGKTRSGSETRSGSKTGSETGIFCDPKPGGSKTL